MMAQEATSNIILADIGINTHDPVFYSLSILEKINILETSLKKLNESLPSSTYRQPIKAILTAPEYFFAKDMRLVEIRQYTQGEARHIERQLVDLSKKFPKILIIPGTIAWQKNMLPLPEKKDIHYPNLADNQVYSAKKLEKSTYFKSKRARGISVMEDDWLNYCRKQGDARLLEAREAINSTIGKNIGHTGNSAIQSNDPRHKLRMMFTEEKLDEMLLSRNTAYFYLNGVRLYKYHKWSDYQEVLDTNPNVYIPGKNKPPVVSIKGIRFGIEICLDHACRTLKKYMELHQIHGIDIHLILSASVGNETKNQMVKNGYLIHSSSSPNSREYLKRHEKATRVETMMNGWECKEYGIVPEPIPDVLPPQPFTNKTNNHSFSLYSKYLIFPVKSEIRKIPLPQIYTNNLFLNDPARYSQFTR